MASNAADPSSEAKTSLEELMERGYESLISRIRQLKAKIEAVRHMQIKEKLYNNGKKLQSQTHKFFSAACVANSSVENNSNEAPGLEGKKPLCVVDGLLPGSEDRDLVDIDESTPHNTMLPKIQRIPLFTTWIYLDKNQRMDEQSVVERKCMYKERSGIEALVCSDSEDDLADGEDNLVDIEQGKHKFSDGEDQILWMAFEGYGLNESVADVVSHFIGGTRSEILERYNELKQNFDALQAQGPTETNVLLEKSLSGALDSFDNLFCRRCLVFNCRLHGCSQTVVYPSEKPLGGLDYEDKKACSEQCYLVVRQAGQGQTADNPLEILSSSSCDEMEDGNEEVESSCQVLSSKKMVDDHLITEITVEKWKPFEKDMYNKGLEIFGRNSCMIARNLLSGLRTCIEVYNYMANNEAVMTKTNGVLHSSENRASADADDTEQDLLLRPRSRVSRKRGRGRRLKYTSKSNGFPSSWRRIGTNSQELKQYSPCTCQSMCGEDCSCLKSGTCCEKYCGCSKSCKNRFRGCHCAKGLCRSRQCPCFAADRECDPDVCRNCWVSCGGGSLGEPLKQGDGHCGNMNMLLKQKKRVLLGISDVAGWGSFTKDTLNKNDWIGEYTGEVISHEEADKRGEFYEEFKLPNTLFDLNEQQVLDARHRGNKLKFANHSANPNCGCKVMLVAGDHRAGIFARERIEAGEELFYDYGYGPDVAPEWFPKPESSKKGGSASQSRPRKHQSR